jgi:hypothetical protein
VNGGRGVGSLLAMTAVCHGSASSASHQWDLLRRWHLTWKD